MKDFETVKLFSKASGVAVKLPLFDHTESPRTNSSDEAETLALAPVEAACTSPSRRRTSFCRLNTKTPANAAPPHEDELVLPSLPNSAPA